MIQNRLLTTLGYYMPSFYYMNIGEGNDKLDVNKLNDHDLSVFFHEYIHYLQDITTFDGVNRAYCVNDLLKALFQVVYKDKAECKVPIPLDIIDERVLLENNIIASTSGSSLNIPKCNAIRYETVIDHLEAGTLKYDIPVTRLWLEDLVCYNFGSTAIQESMAYLMQRQCTNIDYTSPDAPYEIAVKLAYGICPEVFCDGVKIVALCDASLMSTAPGLIFCQVASECKKRPNDFRKPESIIDYTLKLEGEDHLTKKKSTIGDFYFDKVELIKKQLRDYIQVEGLNFSESLDKCISLAVDYRRNNPYFMIDIARGGYIKHNKAFLKVLTEFGSPLIVNNKGIYHQCPSSKFDNGFMMYFSAILQMFNLLLYGKQPCQMKNWCINSGICVDERCDISPWEHCTDKSLCPFGFLWKHRNLSDYQPV